MDTLLGNDVRVVSLLTGGKLVAPTRNGDNVNGKSIEGGTVRVPGKGDFVLGARGRAHWFSNVQGSLTEMALHLADARFEPSVLWSAVCWVRSRVLV